MLTNFFYDKIIVNNYPIILCSFGVNFVLHAKDIKEIRVGINRPEIIMRNDEIIFFHQDHTKYLVYFAKFHKLPIKVMADIWALFTLPFINHDEYDIKQSNNLLAEYGIAEGEIERIRNKLHDLVISHLARNNKLKSVGHYEILMAAGATNNLHPHLSHHSHKNIGSNFANDIYKWTHVINKKFSHELRISFNNNREYYSLLESWDRIKLYFINYYGKNIENFIDQIEILLENLEDDIVIQNMLFEIFEYVEFDKTTEKEKNIIKISAILAFVVCDKLKELLDDLDNEISKKLQHAVKVILNPYLAKNKNDHFIANASLSVFLCESKQFKKISLIVKYLQNVKNLIKENKPIFFNEEKILDEIVMSHFQD